MKILKYIFLLLILSAFAVVVFIATQNGKYTITRQKVIFAPKETLFGYINDYQNWENLNLLTGADTTATYNYSDNTAGTGAFMSWQKGDTDGTIKTIAAANDSISQLAKVNGLESDLKWFFKDTLGGTKVSVTIEGQLTFAEKAQALLNSEAINTTYSNSAAKGLENLNTYLVSDLKKFDIKVAQALVKKTGTFYLGHTATTLRKDISKTTQEYFKKLQGFSAKNKIVTTGEPFVLYKNYSHQRDTLTYTVCIPIKDELFTSPGSEFESGKLEAFNALKTTLTGDYSHLPKAWQAAQKHIAEKALPENTALPYVVNYAKNIKHTRRPSMWVTDVYVPVGPAITPTLPADSTAVAAPVLRVVSPATRPATTPPTGTTQKPKTTTAPAGTAPKPATTKPKTTPPATPAPKPATENRKTENPTEEF
ncbi:hypothetical protein AM493_19185 [Flavobacterium akiainvivens]|uniref:AraC effector-binding domain-containing protein n=1 Tax=Flavobacterium akiainvivens TaxID=1202724 RepID=A0A0M9VJN3_9FLAO|nr:GyrI-like domain-containing protein [Flavobacterium akiainvivens]KOS07942.1 hypothetical protein AM493_19185 [Flavobacterium akiainvivens]SFQ29359.1 hypothetical protein SAMN05444144_102419 [Flavobacterium akiainvivens]